MAKKPAEKVPLCPVCSRPSAALPETRPGSGGSAIEAEKSSAPFCSPRCKAIDLGRWLSEAYRIPGESVELDGETPPRTSKEDLEA